MKGDLYFCYVAPLVEERSKDVNFKSSKGIFSNAQMLSPWKGLSWKYLAPTFGAPTFGDIQVVW